MASCLWCQVNVSPSYWCGICVVVVTVVAAGDVSVSVMVGSAVGGTDMVDTVM